MNIRHLVSQNAVIDGRLFGTCEKRFLYAFARQSSPLNALELEQVVQSLHSDSHYHWVNPYPVV